MKQHHINTLRNAIDLADGMGMCNYHTCVIGQLLMLEGEDDPEVYNACHNVYDLWEMEYTDRLDPYPMDLLTDLQNAWDSTPFGSEEETKAHMHKLVNEYVA